MKQLIRVLKVNTTFVFLKYQTAETVQISETISLSEKFDKILELGQKRFMQ